ncbi:MAG: heavy-metal-associated domain-containing protein [Saprospiraceae bacterium]
MNIQFKTNLKCAGCIATLKPHLDAVEGILHWEADVLLPNKPVTVEVESENVLPAIQEAFTRAGFVAAIMP